MGIQFEQYHRVDHNAGDLIKWCATSKPSTAWPPVNSAILQPKDGYRHRQMQLNLYPVWFDTGRPIRLGQLDN